MLFRSKPANSNPDLCREEEIVSGSKDQNSQYVYDSLKEMARVEMVFSADLVLALESVDGR